MEFSTLRPGLDMCWLVWAAHSSVGIVKHTYGNLFSIFYINCSSKGKSFDTQISLHITTPPPTLMSSTTLGVHTFWWVPVGHKILVLKSLCHDISNISTFLWASVSTTCKLWMAPILDILQILETSVGRHFLSCLSLYTLLRFASVWTSYWY